MPDISTNRIGGAVPSLDAFRETAKQSEEFVLSADGQSFQVIGQGAMESASGTSSRSVSWVKADADTTDMFIRSMSQTFGKSLSDEVAKELGLQPAPGKTLASRQVQHALDMIETGKSALTGVDFLLRLEFSAVAGGSAFRSLAAEMKLPAASLNPSALAQIDVRMQRHFDDAAAQGQTPVPSHLAMEWLRADLSGL